MWIDGQLLTGRRCSGGCQHWQNFIGGLLLLNRVWSSGSLLIHGLTATVIRWREFYLCMNAKSLWVAKNNLDALAASINISQSYATNLKIRTPPLQEWKRGRALAHAFTIGRVDHTQTAVVAVVNSLTFMHYRGTDLGYWFIADFRHQLISEYVR